LVYAFFVSHWLLSVLFQSMFQHRYAAHKMYTMGPRTEKVIHFLTWLVQGSSYLNPRGYAILHREHHAFSDTERDVPRWKLIDVTLGQSWPMRVLFGVAYAAFYFAFATHWWQIAFMLPFHFVMGPVHGAIVNWCGHKYGYQSFDNGDKSRNTLPIDVLTMGELFQNNHHKYGASPNFAARWFEIDPTWQVLKLLAAARIVTIRTPQRAEYPEPIRHAA